MKGWGPPLSPKVLRSLKSPSPPLIGEGGGERGGQRGKSFGRSFTAVVLKLLPSAQDAHLNVLKKFTEQDARTRGFFSVGSVRLANAAALSLLELPL